MNSAEGPRRKWRGAGTSVSFHIVPEAHYGYVYGPVDGILAYIETEHQREFVDPSTCLTIALRVGGDREQVAHNNYLNHQLDGSLIHGKYVLIRANFYVTNPIWVEG